MAKVSAINNNLITVCLKYETEAKDVFVALTEHKPIIEKELNSQLKLKKSLKWYLAVLVEFSKITQGVQITKSPTFHGKTRVLLTSDDLDMQFNEALNKIHESMSKFVQEGSAWSLNRVKRIDLCMVKYQPLYGSSYIPTPKEISNRRQGILNIQNKDNKCFLWSVLAQLHPNPSKNTTRVNYYKQFENDLNAEGLNFPLSIETISKFEELNPGISVNVFGYEHQEVQPLRVTKHKNRPNHVNLLLLFNEQGNTHYCLITSLSRLLSKLTKHKATMHYCNYCLHRFTSQDMMINHTCITPPTHAIDLAQNSTSSCFIATPKDLAASAKGLVNVHNPKDNKSFVWSILAALYPDLTKNNCLTHYKPYEGTIDMTGIQFPVNPKDCDKFEAQNPKLSVNIFGYEDKVVYPIRITDKKVGRLHTNLLLLTNEQNNTHYCLITSLSRLLSKLTKHTATTHYCNYCLHRFSNEYLLTEHIPNCEPFGAQKTRLPETDDHRYMYFKNYTLCHKVPFTIYCDFESFCNPIESCERDPASSSTTNKSMHTPSGFCYVIVDINGKAYKPPVLYTGPDVIDHFLTYLLNEAKELVPFLKKNEPIHMTEEDEVSFKNATDCHLCRKPLGEDRVRNHDHLSGEYIGPAHNVCNINYKVPQHIPVFFHNFRGYDAHHIMQGLGKYKEERLSVIANTSERYLSVTLDSLRFLDSLQFMNASLDTLVSNLEPSKFKILREFNNVDLLLRKGVFPYAWFTDESKLLETCLPDKASFYNDLTESHISDQDYEHACNVWSTFNMTTFKQYHDLYLMTDVLLLADVFENFRATSIKYYDVDPCHFYSAPGLAWNAMLKMTDVKLELITDINQYNLIENSIRGGVSMIPNRYAKANNPYLPNHDSTKPTSYLMYLDCTNLYGTAMTQPLPYSGFRWLYDSELATFDVTTIPDDSEDGYILEVDLAYPDRLHDLHSDFPLAPERTFVTEDMLSPYSKTLQTQLDISQTKVSKLLTTLNDKTKYTVHYRTLKLYLELGLVLNKVHRVLVFKQSPWLKPFIDFNTDKRKQAKNSFEKDFFKLMNNSTYGRTLMNVRKHTDFKLVTTEKKLIKLTANPRMTNFVAFNENLAGVSLKKKTVFLNKPIYAGFTVLELSKHLMYNFYYNWAVAKYNKNVTLCMTDTDSLLISVNTQDIYKDIKQDLHLFDTSDYPPTHPCFSENNKKKLGTFKDETNSNPISEFCGLRAKCYSILQHDATEKKVAKGVPRTAIKKQLTHSDYRNCLFGNTEKLTTSNVIRSDKHQLYTQSLCKLSLSPYDDKRYMLNSVETVAYGHVKVRDLDELAELLEQMESNEIAIKKRKAEEELAGPYKKSCVYKLETLPQMCE